MAFDALAELRAAGNPIDSLSPAQQDALRNLSPAEVATLNSVREKVEAATDVEGHTVAGVGIF